MLTRRSFLSAALTTAAGGAALAAGRLPLLGAEHLAWPGPIGLEIYTVRHMFAAAPEKTLRQVRAIGYSAVELDLHALPGGVDGTRRDLQRAGLVTWSGTWTMPGTAAEWDATISHAKALGMQYIVCMMPIIKPASFWREQAKVLARAGDQAARRNVQLCYHPHWPEFVRVGGGPSAMEVMLHATTPRQLKVEADIFWMTWAKQDPVAWFRRYPGRFPLLHIKDMKKQMPAGDHFDAWPKRGTIPFAYVGSGRIDWSRVFQHVRLAGAKHIYVEQDECSLPVLTAIRRSYQYLRHLNA
ncbi:MAG: sugar phosphate isomerase/epimerase family protein [Terriglobales bacterium]